MLERFGRWLARHGYLDDETGELDGVDAWWLAAARAPSGVLGPVRDARRTPGFEVHAGVRVAAGDRAGREQLCPKARSKSGTARACRGAGLEEAGPDMAVRYVTRPPFAEAPRHGRPVHAGTSYVL